MKKDKVLFGDAKKLLSLLPRYEHIYISREQNKEAARLANEAIDTKDMLTAPAPSVV